MAEGLTKTESKTPQTSVDADVCCPLSDTACKIADTFRDMVMRRGFNAVSYGDLAKALGIRTASIHYHFPTKAALGVTVLKRYAEAFKQVWAEVSPDDPESYKRAYEGFMAPIRPVRDMEGVSCLFGVLGAEYQTLCPDIQSVISGFFAEQEKWLAKVFEGGREAGVFQFKGPARDFAKLYVSALQGAMLIKKSTSEPAHFDAVVGQLEAMLFGGEK